MAEFLTCVLQVHIIYTKMPLTARNHPCFSLSWQHCPDITWLLAFSLRGMVPWARVSHSFGLSLTHSRSRAMYSYSRVNSSHQSPDKLVQAQLKQLVLHAVATLVFHRRQRVFHNYNHVSKTSLPPSQSSQAQGHPPYSTQRFMYIWCSTLRMLADAVSVRSTNRRFAGVS